MFGESVPASPQSCRHNSVAAIVMAVILRESGISSTPQLLDSSPALWNTGPPAFAGRDGCERDWTVASRKKGGFSAALSQSQWREKLLAGGFARGFRLLLGLEVFAGHLIDRLHRQTRLAAVVEAEKLDLDLVAFLDDVGGLLHAVGRELADVDETVLGAEEVHEGAELHHLDHGAGIDLFGLPIGGVHLIPLDRGLVRLGAAGSDLNRALVIHFAP